MAVSLNESLLDPSKAPAVQADVRELIDAEVSDKKGASGLVVKGGYGAVKKVSPSIIEDAVSKLWPGFVEQLDPFWKQYTESQISGAQISGAQNSGAQNSGTFGDYLVTNGDTAADALLSVTDSRIDETSKSAVKKTYSSLRPSAKKNVTEALPRIGALVQKWAG